MGVRSHGFKVDHTLADLLIFSLTLRKMEVSGKAAPRQKRAPP